MTTHSPTVNVEEAAELLKVHPETVLKMLKAGKIPAAKVGRAWVMLTEDVMAYIRNQIVDQMGDRLGKQPTKARRPGRSLASSRTA